MNQKQYAQYSGTLFLIVAIVHLLRVALSWSLYIGGWVVPMWVSWAVLLITGYLAYHGLKLAK